MIQQQGDMEYLPPWSHRKLLNPFLLLIGASFWKQLKKWQIPVADTEYQQCGG